MDISGLSSNGLVTLAQALQTRRVQEQVATSILKLANDQIEQTGELAMQLIESTPGALGQNVDVRA
ncbi:MAG TPA: YjfB family protein [Methylococcaceae bacterium]|nr:YjfB family protein [Methylococcaceae bacterium]